MGLWIILYIACLRHQNEQNTVEPGLTELRLMEVSANRAGNKV